VINERLNNECDNPFKQSPNRSFSPPYRFILLKSRKADN
jgi:hypothetical protein